MVVTHLLQLDGLAMQTGIYATLFVTRGHSYDMHSAMWYGMDNAMDFWEDVLKLEPDQVMKQFELLGCRQNKSKSHLFCSFHECDSAA